MAWFYADREARPVGPLTLEELQSHRVQGLLTAETYVIEQTPLTTGTWRRYREAFPTGTLPPVLPELHPPAPPVPVPAPAFPVPGSIASTPHPLFPSASHAPAQTAATYSPMQLPPAVRTAPTHAPLLPPANRWCQWGFWLGIGSFLGLIFCGLGVVAAPFGLVFSILGLTQVLSHPEQRGRGMAITGLLFSSFVLLLALIVGLSVAIPAIRGHMRTATEQTTNDSE